jgi:AraC-like DNA-binding protein
MVYIPERFNKRHQRVGPLYRADTKRSWWMRRGKERLKEVIPALKEIFELKDKKSKDQVMSEAHLQYGYTLKDIAEYIGLYYTTVSRTIKKIEGEDEK